MDRVETPKISPNIRKENFKMENLNTLISEIKESLVRKINPNQAEILAQQIRSVFDT